MSFGATLTLLRVTRIDSPYFVPGIYIGYLFSMIFNRQLENCLRAQHEQMLGTKALPAQFAI